MIRFPDVFTRMHSASLIDPFGIGLIFLGLALHVGFTLALGKLLVILVFVLLTSPTGTHALCRAALADGVQPQTVDHSRAHIGLPPETETEPDPEAPKSSKT
jgi:multicomponent Na+:H+ antiporter subunit G